jgi:ribosomal protein S17E
VKLEASIEPNRVSEVPHLAAEAERLGFDGVLFRETKHDPFVMLPLAATVTKRVRLGKIRTAKVKRVAREIVERYGNQVSTSFEENKVLVRQVLTGQVSKKFANKVAGYLTRLAKLAQRKAAQEQVQAEQG